MSEAFKNLTREELLALIKKQAAEIALLKAEIQSLQAQLARATKTSANSSKPPSSDIVKQQKQTPSGKKN